MSADRNGLNGLRSAPMMRHVTTARINGKKPPFRYKLCGESGFLCVISACRTLWVLLSTWSHVITASGSELTSLVRLRGCESWYNCRRGRLNRVLGST